MMGAMDVRILEAEEQQKPVDAPKPPKDNTPTSPMSKAVADLFGRKHEAAWSDEEVTAYKQTAQLKTIFTLENMNIITAFYTSERKKEEHHCRTSVLTFLRHFGTELDKSVVGKARTPNRKNEWPDSRPKLIVMPDPAEQERIRAAALEQAKEFRKSQSHAS